MSNERKNEVPRLDGVTFPSRRHTIGQAGRIVSDICTEILRKEGSGVDTTNGFNNRAEESITSAPHLATISIIWNNPRAAIADILIGRSET